MTQFSFIVTIEGTDVLSDAALDTLFEAGCDDATFSACDGAQVGAFDRDAATFADAVASAIAAVESAVPGARVVQVTREPEAAAAG